jgi:hypothetical protein
LVGHFHVLGRVFVFLFEVRKERCEALTSKY